MKRQRNDDDDDENSNFNQNRKFKSFEDDKFQNNQNQQQQLNQINQFKQRFFTRAIVKRFREFDNVKIFLFEIECHYCHKKKHHVNNCFEKQTVNTMIDEIFDSKNEKISQTSHKRNKKNK